MDKSSKRRRVHPNGWKRTAESSEISVGRSTASAGRWTASAPGSRVSATSEPALIARPSRDRSLSDGVVIEASVVARLLGLRLLRLRAHVTVLPADVEPLRAVPSEPVPPFGDGRLDDAVALLARASRTLDEAKRNSR